MSYGVSLALQVALFDALQTDPGLSVLIGDAVYDTMPTGPRPELYVALGPEQVRDRSDKTGDGALHEVTISVVSDLSGFARAKTVAAAVSDILHDADLTLGRGTLIYLNFHRARARRVRNGDTRRIDMTFLARVSDDAPV